jgi:hypothetical protein
MSIELNTEILNQSSSTSCFIHEPKGNQILNIDNTNFISTLGLAQKILLEKPILKRGVHINEDFDLVDPKEEEEEDSDSKRNWEEEDSDSKRNWEEEDPDTKVQLQEHLLEQQQDDLIWSPFGQRMVTPKDFKTFEEPVELIIKPVKQEPVKQEPVKQEPVKQEPVKQEPVKIKQNLFEKLLQKYKKKADKINEIIERQEAERQKQEQDNFCESAHEDLRENFEEIWQNEGQGQPDTVDCLLSAESIQNTFYDFAELADCFEEIDEDEEEEEQQQKQQNPEQCNCLQEDQEEEKCEECQKKPPKKLKKFEKCYTLPLINVFL